MEQININGFGKNRVDAAFFASITMLRRGLANHDDRDLI